MVEVGARRQESGTTTGKGDDKEAMNNDVEWDEGWKCDFPSFPCSSVQGDIYESLNAFHPNSQKFPR